MHIPHIDIVKAFRTKFPYPMLLASYSEQEYKRISRSSYLVAIPAVIFVIGFAIVLMYLLFWLNGQLYTHLAAGELFFTQLEAPFIIPACFIAFPLGMLSGARCLRLFRPFDHAKVIDIMNARSQFEWEPAWRWFIIPMSCCATVAFAVVSWCYVSVSGNGFNVKNAFEFSVQHIPYADVKSIKHYRYYMYENKPGPYDHYELYLKDGRTFFHLAPYINYKDCIEAIISRSHILVTEAEIDMGN